MKLTTSFVLLAAVALSAAASIPDPSRAGLEGRKAKKSYLEWRDGNNGEEYLLSRCKGLNNVEQPVDGRMIKKPEDEKDDQRMCWVTENGKKRVKRSEQEDPEKTPEFDNEKYSCLGKAALTTFDRGDRYYHGGCWPNNDPLFKHHDPLDDD
ncbi:hypothetical protein N7492_007054 [Penicillium capsulatum]|uniref:Uncharacterized protein n=1 Tax=Penicillium capsulatum TaxID=69766 RepID=A0A9W9HZ41_9EURO|nr:hypothetical protein N7492_007054 [Penicillium capsulatum]KAJ6116888.1 hypothetical protein N7512_006613 [Penicillium capsulatum]